jgi:hypothetical protein
MLSERNLGIKMFFFNHYLVRISTNLMGASVSKHTRVYLCLGSCFICGGKKCIFEILTSAVVKCAI